MKFFQLVDNTDEHAIINVLPMTTLDIAHHPYLDSNMEFITITKGNTKTLTVINKDGSTFNFHWGSSTTLISESLKQLKQKVLDFLSKHNTFINVKTLAPPEKFTIFHNHRCWQLTLNWNGIGNEYIHKDSKQELIQYLDKFYPNHDVPTHEIAQTGINIWEGKINHN